MAPIKAPAETTTITTRVTIEMSLMTIGAMSKPTRFITLIIGLSAGPAVSLNGSPTVSPMMPALCASLPLPP